MCHTQYQLRKKNATSDNWAKKIKKSFGVVNKLRWQAMGRGEYAKYVNEGEGDQRIVNVDKFELFICLDGEFLSL